MATNQNWPTAYYIFFTYFHKLQGYTLRNCIYKLKIFKTCHSEIISATLCKKMKK